MKFNYPENAINHNSKASFCLKKFEQVRVVIANKGELFRLKYAELMIALGLPETYSLKKLIEIWGATHIDNNGTPVEFISEEVWNSAVTLRNEATNLYKALMIEHKTDIPIMYDFMDNAKQQIKFAVIERKWKPTVLGNIDKPNKNIIYQPELTLTNEGSKLIHNYELYYQLESDGFDVKDTSIEEVKIVIDNMDLALKECKNGGFWD